MLWSSLHVLWTRFLSFLNFITVFHDRVWYNLWFLHFSLISHIRFLQSIYFVLQCEIFRPNVAASCKDWCCLPSYFLFIYSSSCKDTAIKQSPILTAKVVILLHTNLLKLEYKLQIWKTGVDHFLKFVDKYLETSVHLEVTLVQKHFLFSCR